MVVEMGGKMAVVFILMCLVVVQVQCDGNKTHWLTDYKINDNCTVSIPLRDMRDLVSEYIENEDKLIYLHLDMDHHKDIAERMPKDLFDPMEYIQVSGRKARGLLFLRSQYEFLSLTTLSIGVDHLNIKMHQNGSDCLVHTNISEVQQTFRKIVEDVVYVPSDEKHRFNLKMNTSICRQKIGLSEDQKIARFYYECCERIDNKLTCYILQGDPYVKILLNLIFVLAIICLMFCPLLVPKSFYQMNYRDSCYSFDLPKPKTLSVKVTDVQIQRRNVLTNVINVRNFSEMETFSPTLEEMKKKNGVYQLEVSSLDLAVNPRDLVSETKLPVGIFKFIYNAFVRCEIRKSEHVEDCCNAGVCGEYIPVRLTWFRCLRKLMTLVVMVTIATPWIIRIVFFYYFEKDYIEHRNFKAKNLGLLVPFSGSFSLFLTPIHVIFLFCYVLVVLDSFFMSVLQKRLAENFKLIFRKCMKDMSDVSSVNIFGWAIEVLLKPITKFGIFGVFLAIFYWIFAIPAVMVVTLVYLLPTLNLTLRLIIHFIVVLVSIFSSSIQCNWIEEDGDMGLMSKKDRDKLQKSKSFSQKILILLIIGMTWITLYSIIFLTSDCLVFLMEVLVYTVVGIIVNSSKALQYVSLIFMLALYIRETFGTVTKKYEEFSKSIIEALLKKIPVTNKFEHLTSENLALQVPYKDAEDSTQDEDDVTLVCEDKTLSWKINRLLLFSNKRHAFRMSRNFFYDVITMDHDAAPGPVFPNLIHAVKRLVIIVLFLMFVFVVVLGFGDTYEISTANQTLAALAGGLIPWVLTNVLFKSNSSNTVDIKSERFKQTFNNMIKPFKENWQLWDIKIKSCVLKAEEDSTLVVTNGLTTGTSSESSESEHSGDETKNTEKQQMIAEKEAAKPDDAEAVEINMASKNGYTSVMKENEHIFSKYDLVICTRKTVMDDFMV